MKRCGAAGQGEWQERELDLAFDIALGMHHEVDALLAVVGPLPLEVGWASIFSMAAFTAAVTFFLRESSSAAYRGG
ncbi:hypothetical protein [Actinocorallia libanotica]|uniref:Uncharacterized protein n=1 Tax=Actinocorallia libanotica TaxID=46162 RepID=A0ABP4BWF9_9ACTN